MEDNRNKKEQKTNITSYKKEWFIFFAVIFVGLFIVVSAINASKPQTQINNVEPIKKIPVVATTSQQFNQILPIATTTTIVEPIKKIPFADLPKCDPALEYCTDSYIKNIPQEKSTADIVAEWQDRVAQVTCYLKQNGVDVTSQGSATLLNSRYVDGSVAMTAITNAHVITGDYYVAVCVLGVYGKGSRSITDQTAIMFGTTEDYAYINLDKASVVDETTWKSVVSRNMKICSDSSVNKGDELLVLGYPGIGAVGGLTVTKGIISGIENNYFVTDAKIDHGNSGGTAILIKDDCYLGIPSASRVGEMESMGRILKASFVIGN